MKCRVCKMTPWNFPHYSSAIHRSVVDSPHKWLVMWSLGSFCWTVEQAAEFPVIWDPISFMSLKWNLWYWCQYIFFPLRLVPFPQNDAKFSQIRLHCGIETKHVTELLVRHRGFVINLDDSEVKYRKKEMTQQILVEWLIFAASFPSFGTSLQNRALEPLEEN